MRPRPLKSGAPFPAATAKALGVVSVAWVVGAAGALAGCPGRPTDGEAGPSLRIASDGEGGVPAEVTEVVEVIGLPAEALAALRETGPDLEDWPTYFAVYTGNTAPESVEKPPVAGSYSVEEDRVVFTPRFPFLKGRDYFVIWTGRGGGPEMTATIALPAEEREPATEVSAVYPSASVVPANLLKLYIHFSDAMTSGEAERRVRLLRADGSPVPDPFVAPERELWSRDRKRLTLFFDPGRIKRGVGPHDDLGAVLEPGGAYRLVIDGDWPDARGAPLVAGFEKRFRATEPDHGAVVPEAWALTAPAGSADPIVLSFGEPMDRALAERLLEVRDDGGAIVEGRASVEAGETRWVFRPADLWRPGRYEIVVGPALEDLAGNSPRKPFDREVGGASERSEAARLPFSVPAPSSASSG